MDHNHQPGEHSPTFSISFAADIKAIDWVVEGVMAVAMVSKAAEGREAEIETCLREALANAIIHGCGNDTTKNVQCVAEARDGEFVMTVTDPGGKLEVGKLPDPTTQENIELGHGRGVHMMKGFMDDVQIVVDKASKTEVRMTARAARQGD